MRLLLIVTAVSAFLMGPAAAQQFVPIPDFGTYTCLDLAGDTAKIKAASQAVTNSERVIAASTVSNVSGYILGYFQRYFDEHHMGLMSGDQIQEVVRYTLAECAKQPDRDMLDIARAQTLF